MRLARRRVGGLGAHVGERHPAGRAEALLERVAQRARWTGQRLVAHETSISSSDTLPSAIHQARTTGSSLGERDDQVDVLGVVGQVDVGLRGLGRAARVGVVDAHVVAVLDRVVGAQQALGVEHVPVHRRGLVVRRAMDALHGAVANPQVAAALVGGVLARVREQLLALVGGHPHAAKARGAHDPRQALRGEGTSMDLRPLTTGLTDRRDSPWPAAAVTTTTSRAASRRRRRAPAAKKPPRSASPTSSTTPRRSA